MYVPYCMLLTLVPVHALLSACGWKWEIEDEEAGGAEQTCGNSALRCTVC